MSDTPQGTVPTSPHLGEFSDGYHTFNELYAHRHALFLALMKWAPHNAWFSPSHDDGTMMKGWFIAGVNLPTGTVTYHLPMEMWDLALHTGANLVAAAPKWDGHTSADVVKRLHAFVRL